jgi:hypothetical protein
VAELSGLSGFTQPKRKRVVKIQFHSNKNLKLMIRDVLFRKLMRCLTYGFLNKKVKRRENVESDIRTIHFMIISRSSRYMLANNRKILSELSPVSNELKLISIARSFTSGGHFVVVSISNHSENVSLSWMLSWLRPSNFRFSSSFTQ